MKRMTHAVLVDGQVVREFESFEDADAYRAQWAAQYGHRVAVAEL